MKSTFMLAGALALALVTTGCADIAQGVTGITQDLTSSTPAQVTTYADATMAADLATRTVDLAVTSGALDVATLKELGTLNDGLHNAWLTVKAAKDAGQSLSFAAFNAALSAYLSYKTAQGIKDAPALPTS